MNLNRTKRSYWDTNLLLSLESPYWDSSLNIETQVSIWRLKAEYWASSLNTETWGLILSVESQCWPPSLNIEPWQQVQPGRMPYKDKTKIKCHHELARKKNKDAGETTSNGINRGWMPWQQQRLLLFKWKQDRMITSNEHAPLGAKALILVNAIR